jgi:hypothetical protein
MPVLIFIVQVSNFIPNQTEETGVQKSGENQKIFLPFKIRNLNLRTNIISHVLYSTSCN